MSGGHFDHQSGTVQSFANELKEELDHNNDRRSALDVPRRWTSYGSQTVALLKRCHKVIDKAAKLAHEVEWLYSGDHDEDTFKQIAEPLLRPALSKRMKRLLDEQKKPRKPVTPVEIQQAFDALEKLLCPKKTKPRKQVLLKSKDIKWMRVGDSALHQHAVSVFDSKPVCGIKGRLNTARTGSFQCPDCIGLLQAGIPKPVPPKRTAAESKALWEFCTDVGPN